MASAHAVCKSLVNQGFRLIGDSRDQKGFGTGDRVEKIISSCGAFVGVIPFRGVELANTDTAPYKYFLREIDFATSQGLPSLIVADPRIRRDEGIPPNWIPMDTSATVCPVAVTSAIEVFWEEWRQPARSHYIFCAFDLDSDSARPNSHVRHLVERITGMHTIVGNEIYEEPINSSIIRTICDAFLVIADLTDDNINACIEAGMALAARTNVELLSRGQPRRPPFMLRGLQMPTYIDEIERIAILHKIVRPYRRRIINVEL
jgi:hypothetical protein